MAGEQSASVFDQLTLDGEKTDAEPQLPGLNDDEDHPEWVVAIRAYGPDDEPGESRWEHYHSRAPDKETAREEAIEEAKTPGINAIIGISDCYDVIEVTGPYDPEIVTDGGTVEELVEFRPPEVYDYVEAPEGTVCQRFAHAEGERPEPCLEEADWLVVYEGNIRPDDDSRKNVLACDDCAPMDLEGDDGE